MPGKHPGGGTAFYHDDHKVQREFERLKKSTVDMSSQFKALNDRIDNIPKQEQPPDLVKPIPKTEATGIVYVDRQITTPSGSYPTEQSYKYFPSAYTNTYGRYVYGIIEHSLVIPLQYLDTSVYSDGKDPFGGTGILNESYLLTLTDLHGVDVDLSHVTTFYSPAFGTQMFIPEVEPITANRIIVRGIVKPELSAYYGGAIPTQYYDEFNKVDEDGITIPCVRTNLIFKWTIKKMINM